MKNEETCFPSSLRRRLVIAFCTVLVVLLIVSLVANGFLWKSYNWAGLQSAERVEQEHGVSLPASASNFQCGGDAWKGYLDRGASSVFIMKKNDLQSLKTQLQVTPQASTFIPGNAIYRSFALPWPSDVKPLETLSCSSSTGDWLHVEIWPIDQEYIGVWMYTDWN